MSRFLTFGAVLSNSFRVLRKDFKRNNINFNLLEFRHSAKCFYQTQSKTNQNKDVREEEKKKKLNLRISETELIPLNAPDSFGGNHVLSETLEHEDDLEEEEFLKEVPTQNKESIFYARRIKKHLNKNEIKEAIDVLEIEMKKERIKPDKYIYNLLISGCARSGYARKAFKLFFKMKQSGLEPSGGTYTSLLNACANAPTKLDALNKANRIRTIMLENQYQPNEKNYNAMIKAYGRWGDLITSFQLVDEMIERGLPVETSTFNFLLQACASDKELGFRHALLTWHKMKDRGIKPDIYSFNTVLKCVKECGFGDEESMNTFINDLIEQNAKSNLKIDENKNMKMIEIDLQASSNPFSEIANTSVSKSVQNISIEFGPNLLRANPNFGNLIQISEIQKPEDRLLLLGGFSGFLDEMKLNKLTPSIETFTELLEVIPSTQSAEKNILTIMRKNNIRADIEFFNTLIKKRCMRLDYDGAKDVLNMIRFSKLRPDAFTYGILCLTLKTKDEATELLREMKDKNIRINIQILGAMLNQGCYHKDFELISTALQISLDERIRPNEYFLIQLSRFNKQCAKLVDTNHPKSMSTKFKTNYKDFREALHKWYEQKGLSGLQLEEQIDKIKEHPYKKFKEKTKHDGHKKSNVRKIINANCLEDPKN